MNHTDPDGQCSVAAGGRAAIAAGVDGPLPIGEVVGALILGVDCVTRIARWATTVQSAEEQAASPDLLDGLYRVVKEAARTPTKKG